MTPALACQLCGQPAIASRPGRAPGHWRGIKLDAGQPAGAWCLAHWPCAPASPAQAEAEAAPRRLVRNKK